jgi:hypothetical protein
MPWQRLYSEWCDCKNQNAWTVTEYCSLFIDTGRSLWGITSMPLIKTYNIDSDLYGLKGHSIFKSVCNAEALWKGTFGHLVQTTSVENCFSLEDLRRRSIDPTLGKSTILQVVHQLHLLVGTTSLARSSSLGPKWDARCICMNIMK